MGCRSWLLHACMLLSLRLRGAAPSVFPLAPAPQVGGRTAPTSCSVGEPWPWMACSAGSRGGLLLVPCFARFSFHGRGQHSECCRVAAAGCTRNAHCECPRSTLRRPNARIGVMGGAQAAEVLSQVCLLPATDRLGDCLRPGRLLRRRIRTSQLAAVGHTLGPPIHCRWRQQSARAASPMRKRAVAAAAQAAAGARGARRTRPRSRHRSQLPMTGRPHRGAFGNRHRGGVFVQCGDGGV